MTQMENKACPACGNPELEWHRINVAGNDKGIHAIGCYECKRYMTGYYKSKEEALRAWDKRNEK